MSMKLLKAVEVGLARLRTFACVKHNVLENAHKCQYHLGSYTAQTGVIPLGHPRRCAFSGGLILDTGCWQAHAEGSDGA